MGGRYAGILALYGDSVALVRESYPAWGASFWNVPSGAVEHNESPAQGAVRELLEETGLVVSAEGLELVSTVLTKSGTRRSTAWNYTVNVLTPTLEIEDPDGLIEDARWFSIASAIETLEQLPYEPLRVPAVTYLREKHTQPREWSFTV